MNRAAIIGSPNSGKSLLFNRLTGLNHKVANFPGITVNVSEGKSIYSVDNKSHYQLIRKAGIVDISQPKAAI